MFPAPQKAIYGNTCTEQLNYLSGIEEPMFKFFFEEVEYTFIFLFFSSLTTYYVTHFYHTTYNWIYTNTNQISLDHFLEIQYVAHSFFRMRRDFKLSLALESLAHERKARTYSAGHKYSRNVYIQK